MIAAKNIELNIDRYGYTEEMTGQFVAQSDIVAFHESPSEIEALAIGQVICLYPENHFEAKEKNFDSLGERCVNNVYAITIPAGTVVSQYGENEYRIIVNEETTGEKIGEHVGFAVEPYRPNPYAGGYSSTRYAYRPF